MNIKELLSALSALHIKLKEKDGNIDVIIPKGVVIPNHLIAGIREHKAEIIQMIQAAKPRFEAISAIPEQSSYELSSAQKRLWMLSQLEEGSIAYNIPVTYRFLGDLRLDVLTTAVQAIIARHESLRTVFRQDEQGAVKQFILPASAQAFQIGFEDLTAQNDVPLKQKIEAEMLRPFDLENGPLLRAMVYKINPSEHIVILTMHHIISDAWSFEVFVQEMLVLYNTFLKGLSDPLPALPVQYKDYAAWQNRQMTGPDFVAQEKYWLEQFTRDIPVLEFPGQKPRPAIKSYNGEVVRFSFGSDFSKKFGRFLEQKNGTLFMGLLAGLNALLFRYAGQEDFTVGTPIAGREHPDLESQIGFFVNTLAIRTRFSGTDNFSALFEQVKKVTLGAFDHQLYPFDQLIEALNAPRDLSRSPLFDIMLVLQNVEINTANNDAVELAGITVQPYESEGLTSKFDLTFNFFENAEGLQLYLEFNTDIYTQTFISQLCRHFHNILLDALQNSQKPLSELNMLDPEETDLLINTFGKPAGSSVDYRSVVHHWEAQVEKTPDQTALLFQDTRLSYRQLDCLANQFARFLTEDYALREAAVAGIKLHRSDWMIVAILGTLKCRAAYLPLDMDYPEDRIRFVLQDSKCNVVIDRELIDAFLARQDRFSSAPLPQKPEAAHLAYIIYTSGTTGTPKGALIEHKSIVRLVKDTDFVSLTGDLVLLVTGSPAFDSVTFEYWSMLLNGGQLVLADKEDLLDTARLKQLKQRFGVNIMWFTSSWFNEILDEDITAFEGLKTLLVGGDKLSYRHINSLKEAYPKLQVINGYGPTENTTFSLCHTITGRLEADAPIGKPIKGSTVLLLDDHRQLVPVGVPGEIFVGGDGLARGYHDRHELTHEKFVKHPFEVGAKLFRTGDTGCWLPDGTVHFIGRRDDQVKIRGYRIELGEIRNTLLSHPEIQNVAVTTVARENGKIIAAYIVGATTLEPDNIKSYLKSKLPAYMIPEALIFLPALPLTPNGKVDMRALPAPHSEALLTGDFVAPTNDQEKQIAAIWAGVLGKERIGITDNFFDNGGHSLKLIRLIGQYQLAFGVKLSVRDLFTHTTIPEHILLLKTWKSKTLKPIAKTILQDHYPLSSSQRRIWILSQFEAASIAYNIPVAFLFEGELDSGVLQKCFMELVNRHESLRTVFNTDSDGSVYQRVLTPDDIHFHLDFSDDGNNDPSELINAAFEKELSTPFDLKNGPLLRGCLYHTAPGKHVLIFTMHHIISDAWSMQIIAREILTLYNSFMKGQPSPLAPLPIQFKDYSAWQLGQLEGEALAEHRNYWMEKFSGEIPVLDIPTRQPRPPLKTFNGALVLHKLPLQTTRLLHAFSRVNGGTLFMGLLSAVNALLFRYTNQDDIVIGSPIAGREHPDLENQIGFFVNTLPLRVSFSGSDSFKLLFQKVKKEVFDAYEHQIYPFDELVENLQLARDMSRSPLFDVMVALENVDLGAAGARQQDLTGLDVTALEGGSATSKFDLTFNFFEHGEDLELALEYNTDLFSETFIKRLCGHFEHLVQSAVSNPQVMLSEIDYLGASEKEELLFKTDDLSVVYPKESTIVSLFGEQVRRTPDAIAVTDDRESITYRQLDELSNRLAHYLIQNYGVAPEDLIGIELDKSVWMIVALFAVLKSGAAYVPVDPDYPEDRKDFMKSDSQCKMTIDDSELNKFKSNRQEWASTTPEVRVYPHHLAYVIYTSGSTGRPKGCLLEHENVVRLFKTDNDKFGFNEQDVWILFHSFCFDFSVWEIFGALLFGGKLVVPSKLTVKDPKLIYELIISEGVTVFNQTPSSFYNFIAYLKTFEVPRPMPVRYVIFGGEGLQPKKLKFWWDHFRASKLINMYGITETTVHVTYKEIGAAEISSNKNAIGKAIPTVTTLILDQNLQLVPKGIPGEICVGGKGLARGYLNRPELTEQRFPAHPFFPNERLYRSGDKAKLLENGELEYLGRLDDQVKIRGYRIELGEIEEVLLLFAGVKEVIVIPYSTGTDGHELAAYLVCDSEVPFERLRAFAATRLPQYMVPARFIRIEKIPLTKNGKADKKLLLSIGGAELVHEELVIAPVNDQELQLQTIWAAVLGKNNISTAANFFHIGGDSIKALRLLTEINKICQTDLGIPDLYDNPTIAQLAAVIQQKSKHAEAGDDDLYPHFERLKSEVSESGIIPDSQIEDVFPMSDIETGMIFSSLAFEGLGIYHDQMVFETSYENLDISTFGKALALLTEKHPILRTALFTDRFSEPVQVVLKNVDIRLVIQNIGDKTTAEATALISDYIETQRAQTFLFEEAPLWRVSLFLLDNNIQVIVFECHHSILDGWSVASFITELNNLYILLQEQPAFVPEKPGTTYKDYVINELRHKKDNEALAFWQNELNGYKRLDIFSEYPVTTVVYKDLGQQMAARVGAAAQRLGTSGQIVYFSAFLYTLGLLDAGKDITAGIVTNNRPLGKDADTMLGCFLNSVPFRIQIPKGGNWDSFVHAVTRKYNLHKKYPRTLYDLNRQINGGKSDGNPFFDVLFNFVDFYVYNDLNPAENGLETGDDDRSGTMGFGRANTLFDFTVNQTDITTQLQLRLWQGLSSGISLDQFIGFYLEVLSQIISGQPLINHSGIIQAGGHLPSGRAEAPCMDAPPGHLLDLFLRQAAEWPRQAAIRFGQQVLTYAETDELANRLAHCLKETYDVRPGDLVGISLERSDWLIIAVLSVLKSGAAFVPVDVRYPEERVQFILEDSACKLFLDAEKLRQIQDALPSFSAGAPSVVISPDMLAYVIYTSGSTGKPKGVLVPHKGVFNTIGAAIDAIELGGQECHLQFASPSFDAFVWEIFLAFGSGGTLCVIDEAAKLEAGLLHRYLIDNRVSVATLTPSFLRNFDMELFHSLKILITAGEAADAQQFKSFAPYGKIYNAYGPTELSICATIFSYNAGADSGTNAIPIGKPLRNTEIIIVDDYRQVVPVGVVGEIAASGAGLATGYLNHPDLTAEKFADHPLYANEKIYLTGDLGKWLPDGNLLYVGRKDEQVKIRGYRIEPGEIEQVLLQCPGVQNAAVLVQEKQGTERSLAAFVVLNEAIQLSDIHMFLQKKLPGHMAPASLFALPEFPMTTNGKLDKHKLYSLLEDRHAAGKPFIAPRNPLEQTLAAIWSDILGVDKVGVQDDFMALGGHSLSLIKLAGQYERRWKIRPSIPDLYEYTILEQHAQLIGQLAGSPASVKTPLLISLNKVDPSLDTLFLIPPVFGDANIFRPFASELRESYACYGLNYGDDSRAAASILQIAGNQLVAIRKLNLPKHKPLTVLGYSMGASLAFEIVKMLELDGHRCSLVLVDRPPNTRNNTGIFKDYPLAEIDHYIAEWADMLYGPELDAQERASRQQMIKHHAFLLDTHITQGMVQAEILSIEGMENDFPDKMEYWQNHTCSRHELVRLPVAHFDFFHRDNFMELKKLLDQNRRWKRQESETLN